jgi:DNA repair exonuclease SbcCD ATPase subunit
MKTKYPKGAEWRKWDLHIHTPGTAKNDQFVSDADVWEDYIQALEAAEEIKVLGITDYFSIDNYKKLKAKKKAWEKDRSLILGDSSPPESGTINYFKAELSYIDTQLKPDLQLARSEREQSVRRIYSNKQEVISAYKTARDELNNIIDHNADTLKGYKISVDASVVAKANFSDSFLRRVSKNITGTFYNKLDGEKEFREICTSKNLDEEDDVIALVDEIVDALHHDKREGQDNEWRDIKNQVKDVEDLYDYLYSLRFLDYNYQLKQGDKQIEQLSPGERGALLLVFCLLLDKSDMPLVIDQPEDNLDNHSVATVLVPFIRAAKQKRQIIMVTHNPNLAVVSDAEQVIYVDLDKENQYTFSTVSGSIEDKDVNRKIVDVLEGAMPAFNTRKQKYYE